MKSIAYLKVDEKYLKKVWSEVKEDFWGDLKIETRRALKRILETSMAIEVQDLIGCNRWEHSPKRRNYRNGYSYRNLLTSCGWIEGLEVPRVRKGGMEFKTIRKYKQRAEDVDKMILEMFLAGVATRRIKEVLSPILGVDSVSPTTVSQVSKILDKMVFKFHNRKLSDDYEYLILDGIYLNAKKLTGNKERRCVLVAYGIKKGGKRELIDFSLAKKGESQLAWEQFLSHLYYRGLEGRNLVMVVIDGNGGLANALSLIYPDAKIQRCWVHKLKNVANKCPRKIQEEVIKDAREIYSAESKREALQKFKSWQAKWREVVPSAVECLEKDLEELLNFYSVPKKYWKKLRTTNIIERVFREVRRRIRPMSCFQNRESVERIIFAIFNRQNKIWGE
jgi:transposase-like protein